MSKPNATLINLISQEQLEVLITEKSEQQVQLIGDLQNVWDNGQQVDTRTIRRAYIALGKEVKELASYRIVAQP